MAISLNFNLNMRDTENGLRPFGKIGYQVEHDKLDKATRINMATVERYLDEGKLRDESGEVNTRRAIIKLYAVVQKVTPAGELEIVPELELADGTTVAMEAAEGDDNVPF